MNPKQALSLLVAATLSLSVLVLVQPAAAPAVPPGGAQYGVDIPGAGGPGDGGGEPTAAPENLSPRAQRALDDFYDGGQSGRISEAERRQLMLAGTSPELGAPATAPATGVNTGPGLSGARSTPGLASISAEEPGFFDAASSTDGFPLLFGAALLALTAAIAYAAHRAHRSQEPQSKR